MKDNKALDFQPKVEYNATMDNQAREELPMKDKQGREYLKLAEAKEGMTVTVDGDFGSCLKGWSTHSLKQDAEGLYVLCSKGRHHLQDQVYNNDTHCVGIYPGEVAQ